MKNKTSIIIAIIVLAIAGYWYWTKATTPSVPGSNTADTTDVIRAEVQSIDVGDINGDFDAINRDINTL